MKQDRGMKLDVAQSFFVCPKCNNGKKVNVDITNEHLIIECTRCETQVKEWIEDYL